ncbi:MAG: hypothetical protein AAFX79_01915 [Planctomycetota bacterium]
MAETQSARLSPRYWIKQTLIGLVALGIGLWGLLDLFWIYPERARGFAQYMEWRYLDFLNDPGSGAGVNLGIASVPDPQQTLDELGQPGYNRNPEDLGDHRGNWLDAVSIAYTLDAAYTTYPRENPDEGEIGSPYDRYDELAAEWQGVDRSRAPKRKSEFDFAVQWPIFLIGVGGAAVCFFGLARAVGTRYAWDADAKKLTLPGGIDVAPEHIEEFDKRKWHRFYVELQLTKDHPSHAGQSVKVDLYKHEPVEQWILELERIRFPDRGQDDDAPPADDSENPGDEKDPTPAPESSQQG